MDIRDWFAHTFLSNLAFWLFTIGATVMYQLIKRRWTALGEPILTSLRVFLYVALVFAAFKFSASIQIQRRITPENVGVAVKEWFEAFRFGTRIITDDDQQLFAYQVTFPDAATLTIRQFKKAPNYLELTGDVVVDNDTKEFIANQPPNIVNRLIFDLQLETLRRGISYREIGGTLSKPITLSKLVPVTPDLTQFELLSQLQYLDATAHILVVICTADLQPQPGIVLKRSPMKHQ